MKACKGLTSFPLRNEFPALLNLPSTWTRSYFDAQLLRRAATSTCSYFASTAGTVSQETLQRYIAAQTGR